MSLIKGTLRILPSHLRGLAKLLCEEKRPDPYRILAHFAEPLNLKECRFWCGFFLDPKLALERRYFLNDFSHPEKAELILRHFGVAKASDLLQIYRCSFYNTIDPMPFFYRLDPQEPKELSTIEAICLIAWSDQYQKVTLLEDVLHTVTQIPPPQFNHWYKLRKSSSTVFMHTSRPSFHCEPLGKISSIASPANIYREDVTSYELNFSLEKGSRFSGTYQAIDGVFKLDDTLSVLNTINGLKWDGEVYFDIVPHPEWGAALHVLRKIIPIQGNARENPYTIRVGGIRDYGNALDD